jgi:hypothetical protein
MRILLALLLSFSAFAAGPAISAFTLTSASSSELLGTWTTDATSTSALTCGTTSGVYTITSETVNPLARSYSVTSHHITIAGLQPVTTYFCKPISTSAGGTTTGGTELSAATTAALTQRPFSVAVTLPAVRYNDQFGSNGRRSDGDSHFCGWAGDGETYCSGQDGAIINTATAYDTYIWKWPTASDTTLTNGVNVSAWTNAGTVRDAQNTTYNDGGGAWATNGVYAVWDEASQTSILYNSIYRRILNATEADASIVKSPDFGLHWIAAQNNTGPGVVGTLQGDMPSSSANAMWPGSVNGIALFAQQNCKDHRDCAGVANDRSYHYFTTGKGGSSGLFLVRSRLENLTLQDATLIEWYTGAQSGNDGLFASSWSTSSASATAIGLATYDIYETFTFLPDFNYYLLVSWERTSSVDVTPKSILIKRADYPWSVPVEITRITPPGSPSGYLPAFAQPQLATYVKTGSSPLTASIKVTASGYITGANFSDPTIDQYSLFNYTLTLTSGGASSISGGVKFSGGVKVQ